MTHHGLLFNVTEHSYLSRSVGIYRIAHYLREHGLDIEVIDYANHWTLLELQELFKLRYTTDTKFIGFSHMFSMWAVVLEDFCAWVKLNYPHVSIISGSSVNPAFSSNYIDYYIKGFGELAIVKLLNYIISNGGKPQFVFGARNKIIDANATCPAYPMSSLMVKYEDRDFIEPHETLGIEFARGCKFKCHFCNFPVIGVKGDYSRDADDARIQLQDAYDRFGVTKYTVADETFNDRHEKITKFADVIESLDFDPWFVGYIRADLLITRKEDKEELLRMNFLGHFYGVETFNKQAAKAVGKGFDSDKMMSGLVNIKRYYNTHSEQYRGTLGLIIGLPHEPINSIRTTKQWLIDNWQQEAFTVYPLNIPKGNTVKESIISQDFQKYGYTETNSNSKLNKIGILYNNNNNDFVMWENEHMDVHIADDLVTEFINIRENNDFRPGSFTLSRRLVKPLDIKERVALQYNEFLSLTDRNISSYIYKKLNH
jgi:hypothetical protein